MIEAIQVAELGGAASAAGGTGSAAAQPQAAAIEVREFAQAQQRAGGVASPQQAAAPDAVKSAAEAEPSQGVRMALSAFDNFNGAAKRIEALAESMSQTTEIQPSQMLEMTMRCHEFMFQSQLTSNVANRTSDGVQQLFRQQS